MRYTLLFLPFVLICYLGLAQITCAPEDKVLFKQKYEELQELNLPENENNFIPIAKTFIGTPYVEKTLEIGEKETLVVNLRGLDCTTFVENVLAFSLMERNDKTTFNDFAKILKTIRYRNGLLDGYSSRLHYFTDWIRNNNKKGLVKDITSDLGGVEVQKPINFMGTHRDLYPFLSDDKNFETILDVEARLAEQSLCVLPQNQIEAVEDKLENGDIIALATSIKGLDVTHTGVALRQPNGRIHLLHASISGEVKITEEPLIDYLKKIKSNTGIIVARPL